MKPVKGTKTEQNLLKAFAGESQASMRYTFFAKVASKEGYEQIAAFFAETASNEAEHAKLFFRFLEGGDVEIQAAYPAGVIGNTEQNLEAAANGEYEEWSHLYPEFARVAKEEGFDKVAELFTLISKIEDHHEKRFRALHKIVAEDTVFNKDGEKVWECRKCGNHHVGKDAPDVCPVCSHPQGYFEIFSDTF